MTKRGGTGVREIKRGELLVFAVDLGGTAAKCGLATMQGEILHKYQIPTDRKGQIVQDVYDGLQGELQKLGLDYEQVKMVGAAVKGAIDQEKG